jgi:cyclopropane fatty-acyl-phospholipid synthase-like methyltransferase
MLALPANDVGIIGDAYVQGEVEFQIADLFQAVILHGAGRSAAPATRRRAQANDLAVWLCRQAWTATVDALRPDSLGVDDTYQCSVHVPLVDALEPVLDPTLSRSAALYLDDARARSPYDSSRPAAELDDLHAAQIAKLDAVLDALEPATAGSPLRVLEIGCGYGSLALRAVERCNHLSSWIGLTRSSRQASMGLARVRAARAEVKVSLQLLDEPGDLLSALLGAADGESLAGAGEAGAFDRVVCIEEGLTGLNHTELRRFVRAVSRALRPGGIAVMQAVLASPRGGVTDAVRALEFARARMPLGSEPPSERELEALAREHGLERATVDERPRSLRASYAKTLQVWRARLAMTAYGAAEDAASGRAIDFGLGLCEAAFRAGALDVRQLRFVKRLAADEHDVAARAPESVGAAGGVRRRRVRSFARAMLAPTSLGTVGVNRVLLETGRLLRPPAKVALQLTVACAITATLWTASTIDGFIRRCQEASPPLALCAQCYDQTRLL